MHGAKPCFMHVALPERRVKVCSRMSLAFHHSCGANRRPAVLLNAVDPAEGFCVALSAVDVYSPGKMRSG